MPGSFFVQKLFRFLQFFLVVVWHNAFNEIHEYKYTKKHRSLCEEVSRWKLRDIYQVRHWKKV